MSINRFALLSSVAMLWSGVASAQDALPACGTYPSGAASYACTCQSGFFAGGVWGTNIYSTDSNVCAAAQHAGAITAAGGNVLAVAAPGQAEYAATTQNGIASQHWGKLDSSFMFVNPQMLLGATGTKEAPAEACTALAIGEERTTCSCAAGSGAMGGVWGSGPYTADSTICAAAKHAGVIGANGGVVTAIRGPGVPVYRGSVANGVTSLDWESFDSSLMFDQN